MNKTLYSLPVHCLTAADLQNENAKGIMRHFHSPENSHNRFLASLTEQDRAILRHIERPADYKHAAREAGEHCSPSWTLHDVSLRHHDVRDITRCGTLWCIQHKTYLVHL